MNARSEIFLSSLSVLCAKIELTTALDVTKAIREKIGEEIKSRSIAKCA